MLMCAFAYSHVHIYTYITVNMKTTINVPDFQLKIQLDHKNKLPSPNDA